MDINILSDTDHTVRKIAVEELPMLTELFDYNNISEMIEENTCLIENGTDDIFILLNEDKLLGELHVRYESNDPMEAVKGKRAYLYAFRIHEDHQGNGLGKFLMKAVIEILSGYGYSEFTIGVEDDNQRAIHIYQSFGFNEVIARKYEEYQGDGYEYNLYLKRENPV